MGSSGRRRCLALGLLLVSGFAVELDASPYPLPPSAIDKALPIGPCWVEEDFAPAQQARPKVRQQAGKSRRVRRPTTVRKHTKAVRRPRAAAHRAVPSSPQRALRWICLPLQPPQEGVTSFAFDFANQMNGTRADETFQQWVMDRPSRRRHHWQRDPISTAPEPATWTLLIGGFLMAGWTVRRAKRSAMAPFDGTATANQG